MTISSDISSVTAQGNASSLTFDFSFVPYSAANIIVTYTNTAGVTVIVPPQNYTLFINATLPNDIWPIGGTVTYPTSGSPIPIGSSITIARVLTLQQLVELSNQGNFYPAAVESALDVLEMQIQQVAARTGQNRGTWQTGENYAFGDIVQDGVNGNDTLNYYTCVVPNLSNVWATDLAAGDWALAFDLQQVAAYAATATAGAATATTEAGVATAQASAASTSATAAATSATAAASSASAASTSATTAGTQATAADTSATSAATSATTATTQAGLASTYSTTATTQAGIATTQAGIATAEAVLAAASAVQAASTFTGTSASTNTIAASGSFTFVTQANKAFQGGQYVIVSNGVNSMTLIVTSYDNATGTLIGDSIADNGSGTFSAWNVSLSGEPGSGGSGSGTVTSVSVVTANGVSASVGSPTSTPALTFTLGAITPTSVAATGAISAGTTISATGNVTGANLSGSNTGDQIITLTGMVTGSGTGSFATTIAAGVVTNAMLAGSITAAKLVGTDIATVGTITAGTWHGTTIAYDHGGTDQTSYTKGDILYASATNTLSKLGIGTTGQVIKVVAGVPAWGDNTVSSTPPTYQYLTSSGTYTTPANCTKIVAVFVGAGGGGGGSSGDGGDGGDTIFNSVHAKGGTGGDGNSTTSSGGTGGTGGTGSASHRTPGSAGSNGIVVSTVPVAIAGTGAPSYFGGGGAGGVTTGNAGSAGGTNTGGGGGGGASGAKAGGGGGSGERVILEILTPGVSYSYTIGAAGAAGTGNGAAGGSGYIEVTQYF